MMAKYHAGCRQARMRALQKQFGGDPATYSTDARATARKDCYMITATTGIATITATIRALSQGRVGAGVDALGNTGGTAQ